MVSLSRLSVLSVLGLTLSVIGTSGAQASTSATCESVAADPPSINLYKDLPDFRQLVARLARDCPGVLTALDVPLSTILRTPVANPFGSDRATASNTPPSPPQTIPRNLLADITAAQKDLDQAMVAVMTAERAVLDAVGQVNFLAKMTKAEQVKKGWTLSDLAAKRHEARGELLFAQMALMEAQADLAIAISDAEDALELAQTAHTTAKAELDAAKKPIDDLKAHLDKIGTAKESLKTLESDRQTLLGKRNAAAVELGQLSVALVSATDKLNNAVDMCKHEDGCPVGYDDDLIAELGQAVKDAEGRFLAQDTVVTGLNLELFSLDRKIKNENDALTKLESETPSLTEKSQAAEKALDAPDGPVSKEKAAAEAVKRAEQKGKENVETAKSVEKEAIEDLTEKLENAKDLATLSKKEDALIAEVEDLKEDLDQAIDSLTLEQKEAKQLLTEVPGDAPDDVKKAASSLQISTEMNASGVETAKEVANSADRAIADVHQSIEDLNKAIARIEDPMDELDDPIDESDDPIDETDDPIDVSDDPIDEADDPIDVSDDPIEQTDDPTEQTDAPLDPSNGDA